MTTLQQNGFNLAKQSLDPSSKFYREDLASLREHYGRMSDDRCREAIERFKSIAEVTEADILRNCQLDGLLSPSNMEKGQ